MTITYTSTGSDGALITGVSTSANPSSTAAISGSHSSGGGGSDTNLGAIIGGVAGGVAGLILLVWLILLPLRKRAKKQKEVEWLSFGQENDHVNDNSAEAVYGRGAGGSGSGEGKGGSVANVNEIQMEDMPHEMAQQPYHYQNVDNGAGWAAAGAAGAAGAYAAHDQYSHQHQPDQYDAYYAQQHGGYGAGPQYAQQQYGMHQPGQQAWGADPSAAWGAAPGYTSPGQSQAHGHPGLSHSLSVGSTKVGAAGGSKAGSQEGHGGSQYGGGYQSPPLGATSPQQYPQHYQGQASPQQHAQYFQGHPEQQQYAGYPDQRAGSPSSQSGQRRGGGLGVANP